MNTKKPYQPQQQSPQPERMVPHNLDAERALLGSILMDDKNITIVQDIVTPEDFFSDSHRLIFKAMLSMSGGFQSIGLITLNDELGSSGDLEKVGGPGYVASLMNGVPIGAPVLVVEYAHIVREKAAKRRLISACHETIQRAMEDADDTSALIELMESKLLAIPENSKGGLEKLRDVIDANDLDKIFAPNKQGLRTGYESFDEATLGLHPGELTLIAARPSVGKSALAVNMAVNIAREVVRKGENKAVPVFSLEMSKQSIYIRMLCAEGGISSYRMRSGTCEDPEWNKAVAGVARIYNLPIWIDDSDDLTISQIRSRSMRIHQDSKIAALIVDYLQLVCGGDDKRFQRREEEISFIGRQLKSLAKALKIPVVALAQLNRQPTKNNRRPILSDLRESGSLEQNADNVHFLWESKDNETGTPGITKVVLITAKQRNGSQGEIELNFHKDFTRFEDPKGGMLWPT